MYAYLTHVLRWLTAYKDGVHAVVEILGLIGGLIAAIGFFTRYSQARKAEIMKRALDMEREVFLELAAAFGEQFAEIGRMAAPNHNYAAIPTMASAIIRIQVLARQETVSKILKISTAVNAGLARIIVLKNEALRRDAEVNQAYQNVRMQVEMLSHSTPASSEAAQINLALTKACSAHEGTRQAGITAWNAFYDSLREFLDSINDDAIAAICAVREALSVDTDHVAFRQLTQVHRQSAREVALAMFEAIRRHHLALPAESYSQTQANQQSPQIKG